MVWWIIAVFVFIVLILFRVKEIRHRMGLLIVTLILLFFALTAYQIYKNHDVDLSNFDGVVSAGKVYFSWLGHLFSTTKKVTTYAVQQEWGFNASNSSRA